MAKYIEIIGCRQGVKGLRASSHEPSWPGWHCYREEFHLGFIWEISARFPRWEKAKDPGDEIWHQIQETKQTWRNTKNLTFMPITASETPKAVSLQLNKMLMMWKIARIHPAFIPVTGMKCSYGKISSPLTHILGTEPAPPLIWTNWKFHKAFRGKARSQIPGSCEEDLSQ